MSSDTNTPDDGTSGSTDATVSFEKDIKPMFRDSDRACMINIPMPDGVTLDLHDRASVQHHAMLILLEVTVGKMPMGGPEWNRQQIKTFALWIDENYPE